MQPRPRRNNSESHPLFPGVALLDIIVSPDSVRRMRRAPGSKKAAAHMRCGLLIVIVFCAWAAYGCAPGSLSGASASGADGASGCAGVSAPGCGASGASSILRMTFAGGSMVSSGWTGITPCSQ